MARVAPEQTFACSLEGFQEPTLPDLNPASVSNLNTATKTEQQPAWSFFLTKSRLKSRPKKVLVGLIFTLSSIIYGYSLKEITSVKNKKVLEYYGITGMDPFNVSSLLLGITPAGGLVGCIITALILEKYKRLSPLYLFTLLHIISGVIFNITNFPCLIIGKFLQGVSVGYYVTICPICLREISPIELRRMLGQFFSFGKIVGVMISIALQLIFGATDVAIYWRVLFTLSCGFAILQAGLIFFFVKETPTELIEKGMRQEARKLIQQQYLPEHVEDVYNQYIHEYQIVLAKNREEQGALEALEASKNKKKDINDSTQVVRVDDVTPAQQIMLKTTNELDDSPDFKKKAASEQKIIVKNDQDTLTYSQKKRGLFWVGIHITLCRHLTGGSTVITQGTVFLNYFNPKIGQWTDLIVNSVYFFFVVLSVLYVQKCFGKRQFFMFSIPGLAITCFLIGAVMQYQLVQATLAMLCAYMVVYGVAFINPAWSYASEVIPAGQSHWVNITHWVALCVIQLTPPLVSRNMQHSNPYPVFYAYGAYAVLSMIHFYPKLRQTNGLGYNEIVKSYV